VYLGTSGKQVFSAELMKLTLNLCSEKNLDKVCGQINQFQAHIWIIWQISKQKLLRKSAGG